MLDAFPIAFLRLLNCPDDGGALEPERGVSGDAIVDGEVRCVGCGRRIVVSGGILSLLEETGLDVEAANEMRVRNRSAAADATELQLRAEDRAEMVSTLEQLEPLQQAVLLELGCGTGRYTLPLAERCAAILAVDFSLESLRTLARRLPRGAPVALVHADIARLSVAEGAFDRSLSTLVSNLPSVAARGAMYALAAKALRPGGHFVFSTHYYGLRERLKLERIEGHYRGYPLYRRLFRPEEILVEASSHFGGIRWRRIVVPPPFGRRFQLPFTRFSRWAESVPGLNRFANLLLFVAAAPQAGAPRGQAPGTSTRS
jgi:SAM-dependent methyltransferase